MGKVESPPQGQAFFYFGQNVDAFRKTFTGIGLVVSALHSSAISVAKGGPSVSPPNRWWRHEPVAKARVSRIFGLAERESE
jgi:hypothetical protein